MFAGATSERIGSPANHLDGPNGSSTASRLDRPLRRWTINGDFLGLKSTGLARFAREITLALDALIADGHPLTHDLSVDIVAPKQPREPLSLRYIDMRIVPDLRPRLPQVWVQFQLPRQVKRGGLLSFCNLAPIFVDRHIACVHDLQTRLTPDSYGFLFRLVHNVLLPRIGRRADVITTVSDFSKANLIRFGIADAEKIAVVHNGADHALRWRMSDAARSWSTGRPFVLCIGRNETHKNMRLVWNLARRLDALDIDIVVAGDIDPAQLDRGTSGRPRNLRCLGRVSDGDLARGFSEALCFLFPSRTEGFGLPAVEAMSCGCPVIASTSPCLPEICGNAALFADPDDETAWVRAVERLLKTPKLSQSLREAGLARANHFTWRATAIKYLDLMMRVDRGRSLSADGKMPASVTPRSETSSW